MSNQDDSDDSDREKYGIVGGKSTVEKIREANDTDTDTDTDTEEDEDDE